MALSQQIYAGLYVSSLILTCCIYRKAGAPNWLLLALPLSKRLHSIYVLRLFNDCWSVTAALAAVLAYQLEMDDLAVLLYRYAFKTYVLEMKLKGMQHGSIHQDVHFIISARTPRSAVQAPRAIDHIPANDNNTIIPGCYCSHIYQSRSQCLSQRRVRSVSCLLVQMDGKLENTGRGTLLGSTMGGGVASGARYGSCCVWVPLVSS